MRSLLLVFLLLSSLVHPLGAQSLTKWRTDAVLQTRLEQVVEGFDGDVGIYVHHLRTGTGAAIRADDVFPTASLIKVPILLTLFAQVEEGRFELDAMLPYPDTLSYRYVEATDVVGYMEPGDLLPLSQLAFLMLSTSDNLASLWLQALVGGGVAINEWLDEHSYEETRVNSRTPGREEEQSVYGWGQTTPREMAEMFRRIRAGEVIDAAASERMYRLLSATFFTDRALSQVPPTVQAISKQGFVSQARSDVILVNAPEGDYVLAVLTDNQADTSDGWENEGYRVIREVSRAVYQHFNPDDPWRPRDEDEKLSARAGGER